MTSTNNIIYRSFLEFLRVFGSILHFLHFFRHFRGFEFILVFLEVLGVFRSFYRFDIYIYIYIYIYTHTFVILVVSGVFWLSYRFRDILINLKVLEYFGCFKGFKIFFWVDKWVWIDLVTPSCLIVNDDFLRFGSYLTIQKI